MGSWANGQIPCLLERGGGGGGGANIVLILPKDTPLNAQPGNPFSLIEINNSNPTIINLFASYSACSVLCLRKDW